MRKLLEDTAQRAISYLESLEERSVAPQPEAVAKLSALDEPLPEAPTSPEHVIKQLDETCSPATTAMAGPRFFGFVIGGSLPVTLAANWLAGAWDQNTGLYAPPATARLEQVALRWLLDLFRLPSDCGGAFVTGATMANFSALAAARHAVLQKAGWNVEAEGLCGAPAITVVVGAEAHPTIFKSAWDWVNRVTAPVDTRGRMRGLLPPRRSNDYLRSAGNVNTGALIHFPETASARMPWWMAAEASLGCSPRRAPC
jgi:glutamate/tyrosine decarboxylase-like PLP-dependent enzyme